MLSKVFVASAMAVLAAGKAKTMADFFEERVREAFVYRGGVVDFGLMEELDWERVFNALMKQGAIMDKDKPIQMDGLFLNGSDSEGGRRRLYDNWDRQSALDTHNDGRTDTARGNARDLYGGTWPQASNLNRLLWDDELARVAQNYAEGCVWGHNGNRNYQFNGDAASFSSGDNVYLGENIAMGYSSPYAAIWNGFYDEHNDGYWTSGSSCSGCGVIGHYTQMVWADTRYIGCGLASCSNRDYLVCNYYPGGNYGGQYAYKTGSPCSDCDADRNSNDCSDSQCGGCPNPDAGSCGDYYSNCGDYVQYCPDPCTEQSTSSMCTGCRNTCGTGDCPVDSVYGGSCSFSV